VLRQSATILATAVVLGTTGCFVGDETNWASRRQIIDAAAHCGVPSFEPTKVGDGWAGWVDKQLPQHQAKEDCIYTTLQQQGLVATR